MAKGMSGKGAVMGLTSAVFVTALVIAGIAFALATSVRGLPSDVGGVGAQERSTMDPPSSYPLSVVPDPVELWAERNPEPEAEGEADAEGSEWNEEGEWSEGDGSEYSESESGESTEMSEPAVSDDDGELHNGWNDAVSYRVREERVAESGIKSSADYAMHVAIDFDVTYPQLEGSGQHFDEVNEALRDTALSFVNEYWEHPGEDAIERVKTSVEISTLGVPEDADALLSNDVTWAVTYNSDDFISVSFSDSFCIGSFMVEYLRLRCVNANLKTGEVYAFDDVLRMDETIASHFVDTLVANAGTDANGDGWVTEDECFSVSVIGRQAWIDALMGRGDYAYRVVPTFFVDEQGRVNLGVSYWLGNDSGVVRGWWDAILTDEQLDAARKNSTFWDLWENVETDG